MDTVQLSGGVGHVPNNSLDGWLLCFYQGWVGFRLFRLSVPVSPTLLGARVLGYVVDSCDRDIPLVLAAFLLWKFIKKTKFVDLQAVPIRAALDEVARYPEPLEPRETGWKRVLGVLWD